MLRAYRRSPRGGIKGSIGARSASLASISRIRAIPGSLDIGLVCRILGSLWDCGKQILCRPDAHFP